MRRWCGSGWTLMLRWRNGTSTTVGFLTRAEIAWSTCIASLGVKESGVRVTGDFAILCQLRDGKPLKGEVYLDQRRALEAAGLRE
jgi:hypothetical protein